MPVDSRAQEGNGAAAGLSARAPGGWTLGSIYALGMLTLVYAFNYFDRLLISLLFPFIQKDLDLTDTQLGLLTGLIFVLVYSFMGIPIARIADRKSRKVIIGLGFSFWSLMTVLTGFAQNFWHLAATRFLMGAGEAAGTPSSTSMLSDLFNPMKRPIAFSIMVSGTSLSSLVLTPAAGWIAEIHGWRTVYWLAGSIGMVLGLLLLTTVKEPLRGQFDKRDEAEQPMAELEKPAFRESLAFMLRQRTFIFITLSASLLIISFYAYTVWGTTFLVRVHQISVGESASVLGPVRGICGLAGGLTGGVVLARLMRRDTRWQFWLPTICFVIVGLAQYLFLYSSDLWVIAIGAGIDSFAVTMAVPLISLLLVQVMPPEIRTFGMAFYLLANSMLGDIMGPLAVGLMNDSFGAIWGDEAIRYSMSITAAVAVVAGPFMLLAGRYLEADAETARNWRR
ncbi:MFS transporter [Aurantiacibacter xanthus]|uniref:MFS transporter n=1 Tax=Aurantiacibacter xanthus TaxID=1784712 RepID=A0A3A1P120_9SPHN|nr:MFS transporter [Aurantiacibacter xanthus]RIV82627.1 MFS transporter [Aurantiacibacter xanthus]